MHLFNIKRLLALLSVTSVMLLGQPLLSSPAFALACDKLVTDPAGDAANTATGGDEENVENLDIISGGIIAENADTITTEIKVKNLSADIPPNGQSINWYFLWTFGEADYWTRARVDLTTAGEAVYSYGTFNQAGTRTTIEATTGSFNPGPNGTIQVVAPKEGVGSPSAGTSLTNTYADASIGQGFGLTLLEIVDRAPDGEAYGTDYPMGTSCDDGGGGDLTSPKPRLSFGDMTPKIGKTIRAFTKLKVCKGHKRTKIQLQRRVKTSFKTIATKRLDRQCKAQFKVVANFKRATFRSYWKKQDDDHASSASKPKTIVTHK